MKNEISQHAREAAKFQRTATQSEEDALAERIQVAIDAKEKLESAAPELLEALQTIAEKDTLYHPNHPNLSSADREKYTVYGPFATIARAAIAKALNS